MKKNEMWETPSEPYFFQNSTRFQGMFLESFIFNDSEIFYELEARPVRQEGDALSKQIEFLISASKELESEKICPICRKNKIKFLLFLNYSILDLRLSCCDSHDCKEALKANQPESRLIPLNLDGLRQFRGITIRKRAELVFRQAFKIKKSTSPLEIFNKFNHAYLKSLTNIVSTNEKAKEDSLLNLESKVLTNQGQGEKLDLKEEIPFRNRYFFGRKSDATQIRLF